jgi:hypothetical protein
MSNTGLVEKLLSLMLPVFLKIPSFLEANKTGIEVISFSGRTLKFEDVISETAKVVSEARTRACLKVGSSAIMRK